MGDPRLLAMSFDQGIPQSWLILLITGCLCFLKEFRPVRCAGVGAVDSLPRADSVTAGWGQGYRSVGWPGRREDGRSFRPSLRYALDGGGLADVVGPGQRLAG